MNVLVGVYVSLLFVFIPSFLTFIFWNIELKCQTED